jgi:hypothetical protein
MASDHLSFDFADPAYDLRAQEIRARLYACLLGPRDEASGRLLAFADELEIRADAAEPARIVRASPFRSSIPPSRTVSVADYPRR